MAGRGPCLSLLLALWAARLSSALPQRDVLNPQIFNLAKDKPVVASSTCGLAASGRPIRELHCSLAASSYNPYGPSVFSTNEESPRPANLQGPAFPSGEEGPSVVQGGQSCQWCDPQRNGAEKLVDGSRAFWMSPPLSRGFDYNQVNITVSLEQEFHVAYVHLKMANSPRPGAWVLERSRDHGVSWMPWQYFAQSPAQCEELFGPDSNAPIFNDDDVICSHKYSGIVPLDNGEIYVRLLSDRPSAKNFSHSELLQNFTRATDVRLRLLRTNTLQGHLMDLSRRKDPTITRRYYYSIKEVEMGGRCVCHGHGLTCDIQDPARPSTRLCRCEHNTVGDNCQECHPHYRQKAWRPSKEGELFVCEPCNCHGHSNVCEYDDHLAREGKSLDIHGNYEGGGRCLDCQHNTAGINCDECAFGHFRPLGKAKNATDACRPCVCDPVFHNGDCADETAKCFCKKNFLGPDCDACAPGYYDFAAGCKPCDCHVNGTADGVCLPEPGSVCPCKESFGGILCDRCEDGFHGFPDCTACVCDERGSLSSNCSQTDAQCPCETGFDGLACDECAAGYYDFPSCTYCECDPSGTQEGVCDPATGQCLCKEGFGGERCDQCLPDHFGYPDCQPCLCGAEGSESTDCDPTSGQCSCGTNFTGRQCDKCAVGFFDFPQCLGCGCEATGSQGVSCDDAGRCFCKPNFAGLKCADCKRNFYNHPVCEECNCNPAGVSADFAGCDKVPPGELCTCKPLVTGRICDECRPKTWNLQYHNPQGCEDCDCYRAGSASRLNDCAGAAGEDGQCVCKAHAAGRTCAECADGFYDLRAAHHLACQACGCDIGGAFGDQCDPTSGQCRCKPRVEGRACAQPIAAHYFPHLHHLRWEAEDGRTEGSKPVRMAVDDSLFQDFSWKGYAVFSPIQSHIFIDVDVPKANIYRLLFRYVNPTGAAVDPEVTFKPYYTHSQEDVNQTLTASLPPTEGAEGQLVTLGPAGAPHPFVLNPGKWILSIKTPKRLYLDYAVLLPSAYFEGTLLKERAAEACRADGSVEPCLSMEYPALPAGLPSLAAVDFLDGNDNSPDIATVGEAGDVASVGLGENGTSLTGQLEVPEAGRYVVLVEYHADEPIPEQVVAKAAAGEVSGELALHHCPYKTLCRELVTEDGLPKIFALDGSTAVTLSSDAWAPVKVGRVSAVAEANWDNEYLVPRVRCVEKEGGCLGEEWRNAEGSATVLAIDANRNTSERAEPNAFPDFLIVSDDYPEEASLTLFGDVPMEGHFIYLLTYSNPGLPVTLPVGLHSDRTYTELSGGQNLTEASPDLGREKDNARAALKHCPSTSGCRVQIKRPDGVSQFHVPTAFQATLRLPEGTSSRLPVWIHSVSAVPFHMYTEELDSTTPIDASAAYLAQCSQDNFFSPPADTSDFCRSAIFSLTTDFNSGAFPCGCDPQGSTDFNCEALGGACPCRENVIGRQCSRCAPGYFGFPDCRKCECGAGRQCHEQTGQCLCPLHVEGEACERCESRAFGYDALIGCQLCDCHPDGSHGGRLECDQLSGQCLCKDHVGGRNCDSCLAGHFGFPHCHECSCERAGATGDVCDQTDARCLCKPNVQGQSCETCVPGTFHLAEDNPQGCTDCFCFGGTDQCSSSYWAKTDVPVLSSDDAAWTLVGEGASLTEVTESVLEAAAEEGSEPTTDLYLALPATWTNASRILWYGSVVSYEVSSSATDDAAPTVSPDAVLKGGNRTLHFWSAEQPADLKEPFQMKIKIIESLWRDADGGGEVSRGDLMMLLHRLESLQLKLSYALPFKSGIVTGATLTTVDTEVQAPIGSPMQAASVEICACPPPYEGTSCQECADGYYRVSEGSWLGACVPCQCNGHAASCDKLTGLCLDCEHSTQGQHCETCVAGHFGDPSRGTPYDCQACPCPHPTAGNNFADDCAVTPEGALLSCECKDGYNGTRCEACERGFFGDPLRQGDSCRPCDCNGNNNVTLKGSCDIRTGVCANCEGDTAGAACEQCAPWFWGDALEAKNCTDCGCDQCGSQYCDGLTGACVCKELVEGDKCEKCVANAWGHASCAGCRMCNCAEASLSEACDDEGQCSCLEGAEGRQCERCQHGYWSYGPAGCKKCDCEADLSQGTVCDVATGQCQCQPGATGPRCDQCLEGYLRVPGQGCLFCDECVHVLADDLTALGLRIGGVNDSLGNVSTNLLIGAQLSRLNASAEALRPRADAAIGSAGDGGLDNAAGTASGLRDSAASLILQANRTAQAAQRAADLTKGLLDDAAEATNLVGDKRRAVDKAVQAVKDLEAALTRPGGPDRDQLTQRAMELKEQLAAVNFTDAQDSVDSELAQANELMANATMWMDKAKGTKNSSAELKERMMGLEKQVSDADKKTADAMRRSEEALAKCERTAGSPVLTSASSIEAEAQTCRANLGNASQLLLDAVGHTTVVTGIAQALNETLEELKVALNETKAKGSDGDEGMDGTLREIPLATRRSQELERDAAMLSRSFQPASAAAKDAVAAADSYGDIVEALEAAEEGSQAASDSADAFADAGEGMDAAAQDAAKESMDLMRQATTAKEQVVNNLTNSIHGDADSLEKVKGQLTEGAEALKVVKAAAGGLIKVEEESAKIRDKTVKATEMGNAANEYVQGIAGKVQELEERGAAGVADAAATERLQSTAREQLAQLNQILPNATDGLSQLHQAASNASEQLSSVEEKLASLRNKIAFARDTANRIAVGARFKRGASLQLRNPPRITRSAANTHIVLHFKTAEDGLLFFFGNEAGGEAAGSGDFLAAEVRSGRPTVVMQLGDEALEVAPSASVRDGKWHRLTVERTGKLLRARLETEGAEAAELEAVARGSASVLDLHQKTSKFFVGGVPPAMRMPSEVVNRDLVGDIEDLRYHGNHLGLWNFEHSGRVETYGAVQRDELLYPTSSPSVRLNGDGYVEMPREAWNPRKRSTISFSFKTFAQDAVIFYMGKERDFLSIELREGQVLAQYDLGSGIARLASDGRYSDGEWHSLLLKRNGSAGELALDNEDEVSAASPGPMFELGVGDEYFVGGLPDSVRNAEVKRGGFAGCIRSLTLDTGKMNLNSGARASLGSEPGCPERAVRVASFPGTDEAFLSFPDAQIPSGPLQLSLRFRTTLDSGLLASLMSAPGDDGAEGVILRLEAGYVEAEQRRAGLEPVVVRTELSSAADGHWHYVSLDRSATTLALHIDDRYHKAADIPDNSGEALMSGTMLFGAGSSDALPFAGCLGDVTLGTSVLDFSEAERQGAVSLVGCGMEDSVPSSPDPTSPTGPRDSRKSVLSTIRPTPSEKAAMSSQCALPMEPLGPREDSEGLRFGLTPESRLEYDALPEAFDTSAEFSLEFRATGSQGLLLYAGDKAHKDHIALYLQDGYLVFSFNSGSGALSLRSSRSFLDGEWHRVEAVKARKEGVLRVDGVEESRGEGPGDNYAADTQPPFFVAGVPSGLQYDVAKATAGVKAPFPGCLRRFQLNNLDFGPASRQEGSVPCSDFEEAGLYFGRDGAYGVLAEDLDVGSSFSLQMSLKPRTEDAVLLAIASESSPDALTLELRNGSLIFSVDSGAGPVSARRSYGLCDGHWHSLKLLKIKNIVSMAVDGVSSVAMISSDDLSVDTAGQRLFLGGVPDGAASSAGLGSRRSFVGCVRDVALGAQPRQRRSADLDAIELFGDYQRNSCPVN